MARVRWLATTDRAEFKLPDHMTIAVAGLQMLEAVLEENGRHLPRP
jgi:hypothetical protein